LAVEGENHPPPYLNQKIASILVCFFFKLHFCTTFNKLLAFTN
jgi:hypothetical protein